MPSVILIRGGGDLATGVALRLIRSGLRVVLTEIAQPLAVRRTVSFAEAVYAGEITIEGVTGHRIPDPTDSFRILMVLGKQQVPVLVDPDCTSAKALHASVIVDARMTKRPPEPIDYVPQLYLGLGPGFEAGVDCQAVVETRRGAMLGRVYWHGGPDPDTGQPEGDPQRVLRAPADGTFIVYKQIGDHCEKGELVAEIQTSIESSPSKIISPFPGVLRGLLHPGLFAPHGLKIGDIDGRDDPRLCQMVSDKALSVGGAVLEAILSRPELRTTLWM
jgi:xanthine dehydrogenase accessory factor